MSESFGARLRQQRERQQIELAVIAEQTKISLSLLEELERDDLSHWPSGIFRRSFMRDYARLIGLQPDDVVREFLRVHPERAEDVSAALESASVDAKSRPPTRLRYLVGSAIGALRRLQIVQERQASPGETAVADPSGPINAAASTRYAKAVDRAHETAIAGSAERQPAAAEALLGPLTIDSAEGARPKVRRQQTSRGSKNHPRHQRRTAVAAVANDADTAREMMDDSHPLESTSPTLPLEPKPSFEVDLQAVAQLCTDLSRIADTHELDHLLGRAAALLNAAGIIMWVWDPRTNGLTPVCAHGYSIDALERLPSVRLDSDNATAAAFRSSETHVVHGADRSNGAVVVPLMTAAGCGGVLAVELRKGGERRASTRALAAIFAAQLATFLCAAPPIAEAVNS